MKVLFLEALTSIIAFFARLIAPLLQAELSWLATSVSNDSPQINGSWVVHFCDVDSNGLPFDHAIDATLYQFGRHVWGIGHIQGEPGDLFEYRGLIRRNVFLGTFRRRNARLLAGTGTFILKISAMSRVMKGQCTWFDSVIDDVWSSEYRWTHRQV